MPLSSIVAHCMHEADSRRRLAPQGAAPIMIRVRLQAEELLNMNEKGDDHVSFTAARLALSPSCRHLLVCAADGRMFVFALHFDASVASSIGTAGMQLVTLIAGVQSDTFFVPCAAWHPSGGYVVAADARGTVQVRCDAVKEHKHFFP